MPEGSDITLLLREVEAGREGALDDLMHAVYDDLQRVARGHLRRQYGARAEAVTLEPSALVNESFLRLLRQRTNYDNRGHFFAIATRIMLRVLIDYRRERAASKRGGDAERVTLSLAAATPAGDASVVDVEALAAALESLEAESPRKADVVKLRAVWGLTNEETAHALDVSLSTVERDWRFARAWLLEHAAGANRDVARS